MGEVGSREDGGKDMTDIKDKLTTTNHPALKRLVSLLIKGDGDEDDKEPKPKYNRGYSRMHHRHNRS